MFKLIKFFLFIILLNIMLHASTIDLTLEEQKWLQENPHIKFPAILNQEPLIMYDQNKEVIGILPDVFQLLSNQVGQKIELVPVKIGQQHELSKQKPFYGFSTLFKTKSHNNQYLYTKPYTTTALIFFTSQKNLPLIQNLKDLEGKKITVLKEHRAALDYLEGIKDIKILLASSPFEQMQQVFNQDADVLLGYSTYQYLINQYFIPDLKIAFRSKKEFDIHIGINPQYPLLQSILNKAIDNIPPKAINAILNKWITLPQEQNFQLKLTDKEQEWLKHHPIIKLASDRDYLPFEIIDEKGNYEGITADYLKLIEKRLGIRFINSPNKSWPQILKMMKNKELDLLTCAVPTSKRKEYLTFTKPFISHSTVIITSNKEGFVDGIKALKGRTIAVENGYFSHEILMSDYPHLKVKNYNDSISALKAVATGEVDVYIGNIAVVDYLSRKYGITNIKVSGEVPFRLNLSMGVQKEFQEFIPILQKALDSISEEEKNAIYKKWIYLEQEQLVNHDLLWKSIFIFSLILIIVLAWNKRLQKEIQNRKKVEKELADLNKNLEKKIAYELDKNRSQQAIMFQQSRLAQMGEMISMIAHQWRQPLNNISAMIQTVVLKYKKNKLDDQLIEKFNTEILKQISYMSHTIDDFRDFFKPEKEKEDFDICALVEQSLLLIKPVNQSINIDLTIDSKEPIIFNGYKNELGQAILNILNNSKDAFEQSDQIKKWIKISINIKNNKTNIIINDNAGGIDDTIMEKVFDPYFSTKTEKNGSGLGLYMTKIIIEEHFHGEIKLENNQFGLLVSILI